MTEEEKKKQEQANMTSPKTFDIRQDEAPESPRPEVIEPTPVPPSPIEAIKAGTVAEVAPFNHQPRQQTEGEARSLAYATALSNAEALANQVEIEDPEIDLSGVDMSPLDVNTPKVDKILSPEEQAAADAETKRQAERLKYQEMLEERKKALQAAQTDNLRLASFNALGNALRNMVQPIGWAAGGSTAGVQPYDNRQYLESFNRAAKAADDLRNLGDEQMKYELDFARRDTQRAENEYDYQKRRNESNEDYFKRLDAQQRIKAGENYTVLIEKRRENAVKAFYQENARRISHKQPTISFRDFIKLDGLGEQYYGNWTPSEAEVKQVEGGAVAPEETAQVVASGSASNETKGIKTTGTTNAGGGAKTGPTAKSFDTTTTEKAVASVGALDKNHDGVVSRSEAREWNEAHPDKPVTKEDRKAYTKAWKELDKLKKTATRRGVEPSDPNVRWGGVRK